MGKTATNTIKQIQNLKDRGMTLDYDEAKVTEFLLDIGYYRLGFYWNPFEIDDEHNFVQGTKFSDVIKLYYLDVDLRNILSKYLNRIEINFRTKLVYYVSNSNKNSPTWFADSTVVSTGFIDSLENYYNEKFIRNNKTIKAHHAKYINDRYAPAWKTLEFFTFGTIYNIYLHLKDEAIKDRISNSFGVISNRKFKSLIESTLLIRNICAHGDVLFDFKAPKGIAIIPDIDFNNNDRNSLDSCIKVISYFLGKISINRKEEMRLSILKVFKEVEDNENLKRIVTETINFVY